MITQEDIRNLKLLGSFIKKFREANAISIDTASNLSNINVDRLESIENGEVECNYLKIINICQAIGVPPEDLMAALEK